VEGKFVTRFQRENAIFKFHQCSEGEALNFLFPKGEKGH